MKIVFGQVRPDGRQHRPRRHNPRPRRRPRLAVTRRRHRPQELAPIVDRTVYENLFVGREVRSSVGLLDRRAMIRRAREMLDVFGVSIDSNGPVRTLSVALQQIVEIVKTTSRGANVVLLDEPTAAIADREVDLLYGIVLGEQGVAMQYTTHKMAEIRALADRVIAVKAGLPDTSGLARERPARRRRGGGSRRCRWWPTSSGARETSSSCRARWGSPPNSTAPRASRTCWSNTRHQGAGPGHRELEG